MNREEKIKYTLSVINNLPDEKLLEIMHFAEWMNNKVEKQYDNKTITEGIQILTEENNSFDFLNTDEDVYTINDLKKVFNA